MRRTVSCALLSLLLVAPGLPRRALAQAPPQPQAPSVSLPPEVRVDVGRLASVQIHYEGKGFTYEVLGDVDAFREYDPDEHNVRLRLLGYKPVTGWVVVAVAGGDRVAIGKCKVIIGPPVPPVPPGPDPPVPPVPPGPVDRLHVLILYESADLAKLPAGQQQILFSKAVREKLDSVTPAGKDGTHAWRMWDKDVDASAEAPAWQVMLKGPHKDMPCVIVGDDAGKVAYEGPLPADSDAFLKLLSDYVSGRDPWLDRYLAARKEVRP